MRSLTSAAGVLLERLKWPLREVFGASADRISQQESLRLVADCSPALGALDQLVPHRTGSLASPIFICSAGWRSGSTLLQRLVCDESSLVWGEPYDKCCIVQHLAEMVAPISTTWPPPEYYADDRVYDAGRQWIANLYPAPVHLLSGISSLLEEMFELPSRELGFERWGIKEVRFGWNEVMLLRYVYPHGKFLFLYRDAEAAYASYKGFARVGKYYSRWPSQGAFTPYSFAKHRASLVKDFRRLNQAGIGLLVKYEDLVSSTMLLDQIEDFLGYRINRSVLQHWVGEAPSKPRLNLLEKVLLAQGEKRGQKEL
jgi:hypothetical protein